MAPEDNVSQSATGVSAREIPDPTCGINISEISLFLEVTRMIQKQEVFELLLRECLQTGSCYSLCFYKTHS